VISMEHTKARELHAGMFPAQPTLAVMDVSFISIRLILPAAFQVLGKTGRIVVIDGEIRVMCGETDVFKCMAEDASYYTLLSGDGITVSGVNSINGEKMDIVVYYTYHRK